MSREEVESFFRKLEARKRIQEVPDDKLLDVMLTVANSDFPTVSDEEFNVICDEFQKRGKVP